MRCGRESGIAGANAASTMGTVSATGDDEYTAAVCPVRARCGGDGANTTGEEGTEPATTGAVRRIGSHLEGRPGEASTGTQAGRAGTDAVRATVGAAVCGEPGTALKTSTRRVCNDGKSGQEERPSHRYRP